MVRLHMNIYAANAMFCSHTCFRLLCYEICLAVVLRIPHVCPPFLHLPLNGCVLLPIACSSSSLIILSFHSLCFPSFLLNFPSNHFDNLSPPASNPKSLINRIQARGANVRLRAISRGRDSIQQVTVTSIVVPATDVVNERTRVVLGTDIDTLPDI